jgi:peptidoglycan/xylan/chitin deacetylase (PgdA/CDA1 family)
MSIGNGSPRTPEQTGQFVISLDFELFWGVRERVASGQYMSNLLGTRAAIPALLQLFREYEIHSTWAVVGFLFFDRTSALLEGAPKLRPRYRNHKLSPYGDLPPEDARETSDSVFFAPSLIRRIADIPYTEIGTHTFSHYYCLEDGHDLEGFRQDLLAAQSIAARFGIRIESLAFPRNQCQERFLDVCAETGIIAYRGNPSSWLYRAAAQDEQGAFKRIGRLADAYLPIAQTHKRRQERDVKLPVDISASRFLRPYSKSLRSLEGLRLHRIKREMTFAAKHGLLYHLWWHPHNFGVRTRENLAFLQKVLGHYRSLRDRWGFESLNMGEAARQYISHNSSDAKMGVTLTAN